MSKKFWEISEETIFILLPEYDSWLVEPFKFQEWTFVSVKTLYLLDYYSWWNYLQELSSILNVVII